jgi:hypothetical protein
MIVMKKQDMYIEEPLKYKEPCNTCNYRLTQPDGPFCGKCIHADSDAGANVPLDRLVSTFYFDRYNPLGNIKMAEGAKVTAVDEREALVKARELFGLEWIFKLRKKETC